MTMMKLDVVGQSETVLSSAVSSAGVGQCECLDIESAGL